MHLCVDFHVGPSKEYLIFFLFILSKVLFILMGRLSKCCYNSNVIWEFIVFLPCTVLTGSSVVFFRNFTPLTPLTCLSAMWISSFSAKCLSQQDRFRALENIFSVVHTFCSKTRWLGFETPCPLSWLLYLCFILWKSVLLKTFSS